MATDAGPEGVRDLLILGGGITGAAVAREAALAGVSVALVEKGDFASGTSSKSSKLIHGGQRYLETYQFRLVRESCAERAVLARLAPHLVAPLPFLFAVGEPGAPSRGMLSLGLLLYEVLAAGHHPGPRSFLRPHDDLLIHEAPGLEPPGWKGAFRYFDAQADDVLLTIAFLRAAAARGALLLSRVEAVRLLRGAGGPVEGAVCRDRGSGREFPIRARVTIAALGPWSNGLGKIAGAALPAFIRPTRGSHFFLPPGRLPVRAAVVMLDAQDRRCYAIPWKGGTLVGTTDVDDRTAPDSVAPTEEDRAELLGALQRFFPSAGLRDGEFLGGFAGIRAIVEEEHGGRPEEASREEKIAEPLPRLILAIGGKLTTSRRTAGRILKHAGRILRRDFGRAPARAAGSAATPLPGGDIADLESLRAQVRRRAWESLRLSPAQADRILEREGSGAPAALGRLEQDRELARPISESMPYTVSDLVWGIETGLARTADDLLERRTHLAWEAPSDAENARERAEELVKEIRP